MSNTTPSVNLVRINRINYSTDQQLKTCLRYRNNILSSPKIVHLFNSIQTVSPRSQLVPSEIIQCVQCPAGVEAVSSVDLSRPDSTEMQSMIGICQNRNITSLSKIQQQVSHELVHLYDNTRFDIHPDNCQQILCTETRASMLSGECYPVAKSSKLSTPSSFPINSHLTSYQLDDGFNQCITRKALTSTRKLQQCAGYGNLNEEPTRSTIHTCMRDTSPFEVIP